MSAGVADILCITQITFMVHNALLANYGSFWLAHLEVLTNFATVEHGLKSVIDFVTDSGLDEAVTVIEASKHHLEMIRFRFERLPGGRQVERTN